MRQIIAILMIAAVSLSVIAKKYTYTFDNTPVSEALVKLSRNHADINIAFIYKELDSYRTSACVDTDNVYDAICGIIGRNPVSILYKGNRYYIEARQYGRHSCTGIVVNTLREPVVASVLLFSAKDSTLVTYGNCGADGSFSIPYDRNNMYMKISAIGYEEYVSTLPKDGKTGVVILKESPIALAAVTVTASGVVSRADKSTIYVSQKQKDRADNALNVISQAAFMCPEIRVNEILKTVTVNGQQAVILVNGVRRDISYLNSIDPDRIIRIEFTNYADIQFGAPYIDVRISEPKQGAYLIAEGFSDLNSKRENHMLSGGFRYNEHEFSVKYNGTYRHSTQEYTDTESKYISHEDIIHLVENGLPSPVIDNEHNIMLGYTCIPATGQMFVASAAMKSHNSEKYMLSDVCGTDGEYRQDIFRGYKYLQPSVDLYFRGESGRTIFEINTAASYLGGKFDRNISQTCGYDEMNSTKNRVTNVQAEIVLMRKYNSHTIKYGINYVVNHINNSYRFTTSDNGKSRKTSHTGYAYVNASGKIIGTGYSAGIGARYQNMTKNKIAVKGVANISRNFGNGWNTAYLMSVDPEIPNLSMLTDIVTPVNSYLYQTGNSNMKSALRVNNRLSLRYTCRKISVTSAITYTQTHNPIYTEYSFDSAKDGLFESRPANGRTSSRLATELSAGLHDIFGIMSVSLNGGWCQLMFDSGTRPVFKTSRWNLGVNASLWYRNWSIDFFYTPFLTYNMVGNMLTEEIKFSYIALGWKYRGFDFGLTVSNPFSKHGFSQRAWNISDVHPEYTCYYIKDQANLVSVSVRYSTNFGNQLKKSHRTLHAGSIDDGIDSSY